MESSNTVWGIWNWTHWLSTSGRSKFKDLTDCGTPRLPVSRHWKKVLLQHTKKEKHMNASTNAKVFHTLSQRIWQDWPLCPMLTPWPDRPPHLNPSSWKHLTCLHTKTFSACTHLPLRFCEVSFLFTPWPFSCLTPCLVGSAASPCSPLWPYLLSLSSFQPILSSNFYI